MNKQLSQKVQAQIIAQATQALEESVSVSNQPEFPIK
jgi:hypothetical protein